MVAGAAITVSAPDHGGHYTDTLWIAPVLALLSAATLLAGMWLARRNTARKQTRS